MSKPTALLYCQHGFGLGHFKRSLAIARALARHFELVFLNGGAVPAGIVLPTAIRFLHLPVLGSDHHDAIWAQRRKQLDQLVTDCDPALLVVELYPFGRKKFAAEIDRLIASVRAQGARVACSVRDILVSNRHDQQRHDDRAAAKLDADFDAVLVHADARLTRIEDSFRPTMPPRCPIHYTGYVRPGDAIREAPRETYTLVSVGGGIVGEPIVSAAIAAQPLLWARHRWPMTIVGGPFFPADRWAEMCAHAAAAPQITMRSAVPDLGTLFACAGRSVSQCGYNTALEVVEARVPALFVPYAAAAENEQTMRAQQLRALGAASLLAEADLTPGRLADALTALAPPAASELDLGGAARSAEMLRDLVASTSSQWRTA